jgi:hypothetical protein
VARARPKAWVLRREKRQPVLVTVAPPGTEHLASGKVKMHPLPLPAEQREARR